MTTGSDSSLDRQTSYWDGVAAAKTFTHPIQQDVFRKHIPTGGRILDYGCGYGRTCAELSGMGYNGVAGIDISLKMIERGRLLHPQIDFLQIDTGRLPFCDNVFSACTLLAVLTCIPTDLGQEKVIQALHRVLNPGGILYISDYPLQSDDRNRNRYEHFRDEYGKFGVFRLSDGGVVRHHDMEWMYRLLSLFDIVDQRTIEVSTMNGHSAEIFQVVAKK